MNENTTIGDFGEFQLYKDEKIVLTHNFDVIKNIGGNNPTWITQWIHKFKEEYFNFIDSKFSLDYLFSNNDIQIGANVFVSEIITVNDSNQIIVSNKVEKWNGNKIGYYKLSKNYDEDYKQINFIDKTATVLDIECGEIVAVKYLYKDDLTKTIVIKPHNTKCYFGLLTLPLLKYDKRIGELQIKFPKIEMDYLYRGKASKTENITINEIIYN